MRAALAILALVLPLLAPLPAAARFALSLPSDTAVAVGAPSRLDFNVKNDGAPHGLSRLHLRFPPGYLLAGGSAPSGWTVEGADAESGEITFATTDQVGCTGALARGEAQSFVVEVVAPAARATAPDGLVSARGEQGCRGGVFDGPAALPSWNRLGLEAALAAGPQVLGTGGEVTVTLTVTNLSTVELEDVSALLKPTGTASVSELGAPSPSSLTLAPGASGRMTWVARASSAGTLSFTGQALWKRLASPPSRSETLLVGDLDVSLAVAPGEVLSGEDIRVEMTVRNLGPVQVVNVVPSPLGFKGSAGAGEPAGPSPPSRPVLEPGDSVRFTWTVRVSGTAGTTYRFSGWVTAESGRLSSPEEVSNQGTLASAEAPQANVASSNDEGATGAAGAPAAWSGSAPDTSSGSTQTPAPPPPSATVLFVGVNGSGSETPGIQFSAGTTRDLRILVAWQNLSGAYTQRLELSGPNGTLYQRFSTPFSGSASVETRLLVAGTWITEYSLFGTWQIAVYLDEERSPTRTGIFVLTP